MLLIWWLHRLVFVAFKPLGLFVLGVASNEPSCLGLGGTERCPQGAGSGAATPCACSQRASPVTHAATSLPLPCSWRPLPPPRTAPRLRCPKRSSEYK